MPPSPHANHNESHFTASESVRDIVIGMSDGLTVPFALAAGIAGLATATTSLVVTAGLAEIAAGSIAMGLGGYLASKSDTEHYASERLREETEIVTRPDDERREVAEVFEDYGLTAEQMKPLVDVLEANPKAWVDFMMKFELGLEEPKPTRARNSAITIAISYIVGGMIPLFPYMVFEHNKRALVWSTIVTLIALFVFGYTKGRFGGRSPVRSAIQTAFIGGLAAAAAFGIAYLLQQHGGAQVP